MQTVDVQVIQNPVFSTQAARTPVINVTMLGSGPPGPAGPAGGSTVTYAAGENLSAGRVVVIDGGEAFYFQPTDPTHAGRAFGVTTSSATMGNNVTIQISGEVSDVAFTFAADSGVYAGTNGQVTETRPASGLSQLVGVSITATKMLIKIQSTITQTT